MESRFLTFLPQAPVFQSFKIHNIKGVTIGEGPCARFGHSCSVITDKMGNQHLIFIGGSDGNDLLRSGDDFRDIHVLSIQSKLDGSSSLVWSEPGLGHTETGSLPLVYPGRCHM